MADVSFTATSFIAGSGAVTAYGTAGEAVARGNAVYLKASDNEYYKADCTSADSDAVAGFALNDAANGQPIKIITGGTVACDDVNLSAAADKAVYVLGEAGAICPVADLAADDYVTVVGAAVTTTSLKIGIIVTGAQIVA